jgi:hypothetical protein
MRDGNRLTSKLIGSRWRILKDMVKKVLSRAALLGVASGLLLLANHGNAFATVAPELDPGTASSGLILAVGAALLLIEKFRRRRS